MDIFSFVNSRDIQEHLRNIEYPFNSLETSWLIYACHNISYEEKKEYWKELITTMPDCEVPSRNHGVGSKSLHDFLKCYMEVMDQEMIDFYKEEPHGTYVYTYSYLYRGDKVWTENFDTVYPSLEKCFEGYESDITYLEGTYYPEETGVLKCRFRKQSLLNTSERMEIETFGNGGLIEILENTRRTEENQKLLGDSFYSLWFDFPTPFQRGDIIWNPHEEPETLNHDMVLVLEEISTWSSLETVKNYGDNSDMNISGYLINSSGTIYRDGRKNYMDFEYYPGPYKFHKKMLLVLSKFVKGEIALDVLLYAYRKLLAEISIDDLEYYWEELIEEIGFNDTPQ